MRYEISAEGTEVLDHQTGLVWKDSFGESLTHSQAQAYAEREVKASGLPWRLPTVEELLSLVDRSKFEPASDFPKMPSKSFWSSSRYVGNADGAWVVYFGSGFVSGYSRDYYYAVRLVRGG